MASQRPLISILCAVRNDGKFLRDTLDSVIAQTYPRWELIVMDGASTDGTPRILKEYGGKHKNIVWRSEPDEGQWQALDKALALAKGEYLMVLCGQDGYLDKSWLARCVEILQTQPEVSLVWGIPFNMSEDGKLIGPHYAYAAFLRDQRFGTQTKPVNTLMAKINLKQPNWASRLWRLATKFTWGRLVRVLRSFKKREIPQKEDWFFYWLRTGQAFPEGNICVRKDAYTRNTMRYPKETMTNGALLDFCYYFNVRGYLAYGLPIAASFTRLHAGGQPLIEYDDMVVARYRGRIAAFKQEIQKQRSVRFVSVTGKTVSERPVRNL